MPLFLPVLRCFSGRAGPRWLKRSRPLGKPAANVVAQTVNRSSVSVVCIFACFRFGLGRAEGLTCGRRTLVLAGGRAPMPKVVAAWAQLLRRAGCARVPVEPAAGGGKSGKEQAAQAAGEEAKTAEKQVGSLVAVVPPGKVAGVTVWRL